MLRMLMKKSADQRNLNCYTNFYHYESTYLNVVVLVINII